MSIILLLIHSMHHKISSKLNEKRVKKHSEYVEVMKY